MANAHLFFRTIGTPKSDTDYDTSTKLLNSPVAMNGTANGLGYSLSVTKQVLAFDISDYILESIGESYSNNIIDIPVPTSDGTRKINKQENGLRSKTLTIKGMFRNSSSSDIEKLERMRQIPQVDVTHKFGVIGFYSPNATRFSLDPDGSAGYTITDTSIGFVSGSQKKYDFQVTLSFGGTVASIGS